MSQFQMSSDLATIDVH